VPLIHHQVFLIKKLCPENKILVKNQEHVKVWSDCIAFVLHNYLSVCWADFAKAIVLPVLGCFANGDDGASYPFYLIRI